MKGAGSVYFHCALAQGQRVVIQGIPAGPPFSTIPSDGIVELRKSGEYRNQKPSPTAAQGRLSSTTAGSLLATARKEPPAAGASMTTKLLQTLCRGLTRAVQTRLGCLWNLGVAACPSLRVTIG